jgi:hypothetical protein
MLIVSRQTEEVLADQASNILVHFTRLKLLLKSISSTESMLEENTKALNSKASILEEDSKLIGAMERDIQLLMNGQESTKVWS